MHGLAQSYTASALAWQGEVESQPGAAVVVVPGAEVMGPVVVEGGSVVSDSEQSEVDSVVAGG